RHQCGHVCADRQLQGRPGACAGVAGKAGAMSNLPFDLAYSWAPLVPVWVIATLGAIGLVLVGAALLAGARGGLLRLAMLGLLVGALLNPSARHEDREKLSDIAVVVVDDTQSQAIGERQARTQAALAAVEQEASRLGSLELRKV